MDNGTQPESWNGRNGLELKEGGSLRDLHRQDSSREVQNVHQLEGVQSDARSLASISLPPTDAETSVHVPSKIYQPFSAEVVLLLTQASVFGTLARLGIHALTDYDGAAVFPLAWVQSLGCLIMGIGFSMKGYLGNFYGPIYTAITTGFCGSLTTFSSWQFDVFQAWANSEGFHRSWLRDVIDGLSRTLFTLAISLSSLGLGLHIGNMCVNRLPVLRPARSAFRLGVTTAAVLIYTATIPLYVQGNPRWRSEVTAALIFSFPGTFTRYTLSYFLNSRLKLFPLGTFTANSLGTGVLAMLHVLQATSHGSEVVTCGILQGLMDGYCGCLSTVSTFAVEVRELRGYRAWIYVFVSVLTGQLLCLVILGPAWWDKHLNEITVCAS